MTTKLHLVKDDLYSQGLAGDALGAKTTHKSGVDLSIGQLRRGGERMGRPYLGVDLLLGYILIGFFSSSYSLLSPSLRKLLVPVKRKIRLGSLQIRAL